MIYLHFWHCTGIVVRADDPSRKKQFIEVLEGDNRVISYTVHNSDYMILSRVNGDECVVV